MLHFRFPIRLISLLAAATLASANAFAADPVVYQSAAFVDYSAGGEPGGYFIDNTRSIGAAFTLAQTTDVSAIGGYFTQYSADSIFGAIVPLASLTSLPAAGIDSIALAHVVFAPDGSDDRAALSVRLAPGSYAVVFGSGLWGATGSSALVSGQDGSGATLFSGAGSNWGSFTDTDVRLDVLGQVAAVPEPGTWALLAAGLAALAGLATLKRRRRFNG